MKTSIWAVLILSVIVVVISACTPVPPEQQGCVPAKNLAEPAENMQSTSSGTMVLPVDTQDTQPAKNASESIEAAEPEKVVTKEPQEEPVVTIDDGIPTKTVVEGQVIEFDLKAVDPDGDKLAYTYSAPLDKYGKWKTKEGDAGTYFVTIAASDGKSETSQKVRVIVKPANKPPMMESINDIQVDEGNTIVLRPLVTDPENDKIKLTYSGWITTDKYVTTFSDAGTHSVTVTANDGKNTVSQTVKIIVNNVNRAPVLGDMPDITVTETETAKINYYAADLDKDDLTFSFSGPFNSKGEWLAGYDDEGEYAVIIKVTDGKLSDEKAIKVTVLKKNRAPVIAAAEDVKVKEGDLVRFEPTVTDPDGDKVTITYKGWMTSSSYLTGYEDAGTHEVYIIASDGVDSSLVMRTVTVEDVNRAPIFQIG